MGLDFGVKCICQFIDDSCLEDGVKNDLEVIFEFMKKNKYGD